MLAYEQAPLINFKIFDFQVWPDHGPPPEYSNPSFTAIPVHFQRVLEEDTKINSLAEWPALRTYLLARRKNEKGKMKGFKLFMKCMLIEELEEFRNV